MKKKIFALAAMAIYVAILVGGSLAYFTAEDRAVNVITIGKVDIEIEEYADLEKTIRIEEGQMPASFFNVEPGQRIVKKVEIDNRGLSPAWIRAKIEDNIVSAGGGNLPDEILNYDIQPGWTWDEETGYYYYDEILYPSDIATLFNVVTFDGPGMGNAYQGCTTYIQIHADAVQSEGIGANSCKEAYQKLNEVSQGGAD